MPKKEMKSIESASSFEFERELESRKLMNEIIELKSKIELLNDEVKNIFMI